MSKWRLLVGIVSMAQLLWGIFEFAGYKWALDGWGGPTTGAWVYSSLGLLGLLVLALPRIGMPVALVQGTPDSMPCPGCCLGSAFSPGSPVRPLRSASCCRRYSAPYGPCRSYNY